jgi:3-hydroxyacyl-CoA dehydrogenase
MTTSAAAAAEGAVAVIEAVTEDAAAKARALSALSAMAAAGTPCCATCSACLITRSLCRRYPASALLTRRSRRAACGPSNPDQRDKVVRQPELVPEAGKRCRGRSETYC